MTYILFSIPVLLGWLAGWLVNYLADVLPFTRQLSRPTCPHCNANFPWKDYLLFRACLNGHRRGPRVWIVQALALIVSLHFWIQPSVTLGYFLDLTLTAYFGLVFVIDMEHRLILHPTSVFGALLGLLVGLLKNGLSSTLKGVLAGLLIMLAFYFMGVAFTRYRARRLQAEGQQLDDEEALGAGDVILTAVMGLMLGWPLIWFGILVAILLGGLASVLLLVWLFVRRKYQKNALMIFIPYGPYFIISAFLILYFPQVIKPFLP